MPSREEETHGVMCRLHVRVRCNTDIGQMVVISGSSFALGCGNKNKAVALVTTPDSHPIWYSSKPFLVPRGKRIEYRFGLMEGGSMKALERINDGKMRSIVPMDVDTSIEDEFSLFKIEGFGQDSEVQMFEQMKMLTHKSSTELSDIAAGSHSDEFNPKKRLFLVCYHLPLKVKRKPSDEQKTGAAVEDLFDITWNDSIIAKSHGASIQDTMSTTWVGTLSASLSTKSLTDVEKEVLKRQLLAMRCVPIFLDDELSSAAYFGFCKTIMWPTFHNVDQLDHIHAAWNLQDDYRHSKSSCDALANLSPSVLEASSHGVAAPEEQPVARSRAQSNAGLLAQESNNRVLQWNNLEEDFYAAYQSVNQTFAAVLLDLVRDTDDPLVDGTIVWVHDYHLMELPKMLRDCVTVSLATQSMRMSTSPKYSAATAAAARGLMPEGKSNNDLMVQSVGADGEPTFRDLKIVFFLHIPFPTSQIFRTLPKAGELLESMTCADVVGFHSFDHARHFLNATKRTLGYVSSSRPGGMITLKVRDRELMVSVSHVSIEADAIAAAMAHPKTIARAQELREKYAGRKVVVGVDVCQRLSGVAQKLAAFDKMLSDSAYGHYFTRKRGIAAAAAGAAGGANVAGSSAHSKASNDGKTVAGGVVLVQRCIRGGSRPGDEETTSADLRKMVADINNKYAGSTLADAAADEVMVDYAEVRSSDMDLHERLALWLAADVLLNTTIREGLNLMPLEYIYTRQHLPHAGAVIVSEFSTCSSLLNGSLKINPFAPLHVADAIEKALSLSSTDADYRRQRDLHFISSHPSCLWTKTILNDLEQLTSNSGRARINPAQFPKSLNLNAFLAAYDNAAKTAGICTSASRVMIFDYGGTLLPKEKSDIYLKRTALSAISGRKPSAHMMDAIKKLSEDPRNVILIVTGLTKLKLGDTFSDMKNVSLATSNGLVYSWGQNISSSLSQRSGKRGRRTRSTSDNERDADAPLDGRAFSINSSEDGGDVYRHSPMKLLLSSDAPKEVQSVQPLSTGSGKLISLGADGDGREWEFLNFSIDWEAIRDIAMPIINKFTFRTNGTCQTPRIPGIGWSYFGADPEWGRKQAEQLTVQLNPHHVYATCFIIHSSVDMSCCSSYFTVLQLELEASLANYDVKVTSLIQGSIEVVPRCLDKGVVIAPLMEKVLALRAGRLPGFIFVIGDEESDDCMMTALEDFLGQAPGNAQLEKCRLFTSSVSKRACPAQYYLPNVEVGAIALSPIYFISFCSRSLCYASCLQRLLCFPLTSSFAVYSAVCLV